MEMAVTDEIGSKTMLAYLRTLVKVVSLPVSYVRVELAARATCSESWPGSRSR